MKVQKMQLRPFQLAHLTCINANLGPFFNFTYTLYTIFWEADVFLAENFDQSSLGTLLPSCESLSRNAAKDIIKLRLRARTYLFNGSDFLSGGISSLAFMPM